MDAAPSPSVVPPGPFSPLTARYPVGRQPPLVLVPCVVPSRSPLLPSLSSSSSASGFGKISSEASLRGWVPPAHSHHLTVTVPIRPARGFSRCPSQERGPMCREGSLCQCLVGPGSGCRAGELCTGSRKLCTGSYSFSRSISLSKNLEGRLCLVCGEEHAFLLGLAQCLSLPGCHVRQP